VKSPVTEAHTITNPPTVQLIMKPGKLAPSLTSTSSIVNPLKIPFQASMTLFLKSFIRLRRDKLTNKVATTIPTKNPI